MNLGVIGGSFGGNKTGERVYRNGEVSGIYLILKIWTIKSVSLWFQKPSKKDYKYRLNYCTQYTVYFCSQ